MINGFKGNIGVTKGGTLCIEELGLTMKNLFCLTANGDNNFLLYGIAENSLVLADNERPFEEGKLNIFRIGEDRGMESATKLSFIWLEGETYLGQAVLTLNCYV